MEKKLLGRIWFLHLMVISICLSVLIGVVILFIIQRIFYLSPVLDFFCTWFLADSFAIFGIIFFYKWRMKKPLQELDYGIQKIHDKDLDFHISYTSNDELGAICESFELMRSEIETGFHTIWDMQEQQKQLNAIFSHDLRIPLTIIKGQMDVLQKRMVNEDLDHQKVLSTFEVIDKQILRIEAFITEMSSAQNLEEIRISIRHIRTDLFLKNMVNPLTEVVEKKGKTLEIENYLPLEYLDIDFNIVSEVLYNLISNAVYYARAHILLKLFLESEFLKLQVLDDGAGFTEEGLKMGKNPNFSTKNGAGMGLYVSDVLTKKHFGNLTIQNTSNGGMVEAAFLMKI